MRILATDIFGVGEIGVEAWQKTLSWPVSDGEFLGIVKDNLHCLDRLLGRLDQVGQSLVLADSNFSLLLAGWLHALLVEQWCEKNAVRCSIGPVAKGTYRPDWASLAWVHDRALSHDRARLRVRSWLKNVAFNFPAGPACFLRGLVAPEALGLGSFSDLKREYARNHRLYVNNHYFPTLLRRKPPQASLPGAVADALAGYFQDLTAACAARGLACDFQAPLECWKTRLASLLSVFNVLLEAPRREGVFLSTNGAHPINKIVAQAFRAQGKEAVTFHHGGDMGLQLADYTCYTEFAAYTRFVCPTRACAEARGKIYQGAQISRLRPLRFDSVETDAYRGLWRRLGKAPLPGRIKTVMIVGFPMNANRYPGFPGEFFVSQLDLELRLIRQLKSQGYDVLYKMHPDRKREAEVVFGQEDVTVVRERFEEVWEAADAILIKHIATTVLAFAQCTNRPLLLFDHEKSACDPAQYEMLARRCRIVPAWVDADQRIQWDGDALSRALREKPVLPDFSYAERYMFPQDRP